MRQGEDGRWRWHWDPAFLANRAPGGQRFGGGSAELNNAVKAISCPLLLVRGGRSEIVSPALAAEFRALLPAADYVEIPNVGHMVAGDDNAPFTRALLDYLQRHAGTRADTAGSASQSQS
jgi:pimeloyl-ACP methyl ester carboxylesterase